MVVRRKSILNYRLERLEAEGYNFVSKPASKVYIYEKIA